MADIGASESSMKKTPEELMGGFESAQSRIIAISVIILLVAVLLQVLLGIGMIEFTHAQTEIFRSLGISSVTVLFAMALLKLTTPIVQRSFFFLDPQARSIIAKVWNYAILAVALLVIFGRFTGNLRDIGISFGVFSAGLAIALQQPLTSALGWMVIMSKTTYKVGDRIVVRGIKGDVYQISLFYTVIMEVGGELGGDNPTGVKISMPNSFVLTEPVHNYSADFPFVWDQIRVDITYESDPELARNIISDATMKAAGRGMKRALERMRPYLYGTLQEGELSDKPLIFTDLADSSIILRAKYLVKVNRRNRTRSDITEAVLEAFSLPQNRERVSMAYPHTELVFRDQSITGLAGDALKRI